MSRRGENGPSWAAAERFIQTVKAELIWTCDWRSAEELRAAIEQWLRVYNEVRPHEALDWLTPAEKRADNFGIDVNLAA
jgi:transposase InsO family protein